MFNVPIGHVVQEINKSSANRNTVNNDSVSLNIEVREVPGTFLVMIAALSGANS